MKITNREWSVVIFWFGLMALLAAVLLMSGCSATKRVLKDPVKMEKVAVEFIKQNPRKNDTTFLPGKIIVSDTTIYDTIPLPYPVKEKYTQTNYRETLVRDTIIIVDRTFEQALVKDISQLKKDVEELKQDRNEWRTEAWVHRGIWIAIIIFFAARLFIRVIRPLLKAYFKI